MAEMMREAFASLTGMAPDVVSKLPVSHGFAERRRRSVPATVTQLTLTEVLWFALAFVYV
jgi:hypothetical protein